MSSILRVVDKLLNRITRMQISKDIRIYCLSHKIRIYRKLLSCKIHLMHNRIFRPVEFHLSKLNWSLLFTNKNQSSQMLRAFHLNHSYHKFHLLPDLAQWLSWIRVQASLKLKVSQLQSRVSKNPLLHLRKDNKAKNTIINKEAQVKETRRKIVNQK
jgi:hypothetical protein